MISPPGSRALAGALSAAALLVYFHSKGLAHDPVSGSSPGAAVRRTVNVPIGDFSLTDQDGQAFRFISLKGKVLLVTFFYTTCPDLCPLVTTSVRAVQKALNAWERDGTFFLSITTDPDVDVPAVLKSYAGRYGADLANWSFLTGEPRALAPVWKAFGVKVERKARGLVDHTLVTGLIDRKGVLRIVYHGAAPDAEKVLRDLRGLLASR
ncbi:MAG TPA: SCO family protein [Candidatus Binatia bacterium]